MFKRILQTFLAAVFLLPSTIYGQVNHNGDFQVWSYLSIEKEINSAWRSRFLGVMRWGDDASTLYFTYAQWQAVYRNKDLEIAPGYRQEYFKPGREWFARYNPLIDITLFFPCTTWRWEDRNRFVYQIPQNVSSSLIYRNRLRVTSPELTSFFKLKLFLEDEVFFQEGVGFNQNRVAIGLVGSLTSYLDGRLYYMYRTLKQGSTWTYQNVLAFHFYF
jgi:hypothetical protein